MVPSCVEFAGEGREEEDEDWRRRSNPLLMLAVCWGSSVYLLLGFSFQWDCNSQMTNLPLRYFFFLNNNALKIVDLEWTSISILLHTCLMDMLPTSPIVSWFTGDWSWIWWGELQFFFCNCDRERAEIHFMLELTPLFYYRFNGYDTSV
jgi:hypothetical protein